MHRRHLIGLVVAVVAAFWCGLDRGRPLPAAFAAGGEIMIEGVTEGRYADPFLGAAEGLVRSQGYQGDFADLVGMSGLADEATMCRQDCDCREVLHSADRLQALVAPLGGSVTPYAAGASSPEAAWEALQRELKAGRPVMAEGLKGPASLNLVVGCDPASQKVIYLDEGERRERSFAAWTQGPWEMSTARVRTTRLPGPKVERDAVVSMLVRARQPRIEGGCPVRQERTQNAMGLEAYRLWSERALTAEPADPKVQQLRAQSWIEHRQMLVTFLRGAARHQDPDTAGRFREAANAAQQELDRGLRPLAATTTATRSGAAVNLRERQASFLRMAVKCQKRFLQSIETVAFQHLRLSPEQRRLAALNATPVKDRAAADAALRQLLRARDSRARTLGSMAAANTGDAALAPELAKNLTARDPLEARASLAALKAVNPDNLAGLLEQQRDAMRTAGGQVSGTDAPIKQVEYALADLQAQKPYGPGWIAGLTGGPVLVWIVGLALVGLGLVAWKITGPVRLASRVEEPIAPRPGLPEEAARLAALLMRPPATGLMLTHVSPDGPAFRQGLRTGDVICRYGGAAVASLEDLRRLAGQPGAGQREIVARRDLRTVKTVVSAGPIGVNGVAVTRGQPFWRPLATAPYVADTSGLAGEGETWHRFTQNGRPIGFERRRWRWVKEEVEISCVAGFAAESGEEHLRVIHRLRTGEQMTCASTKFATRGHRSVDLNATCTGGRWVILLNGKSISRNVPEKALPSHAIATFASTLPFEVGRAYDVVRADEFDFQPSYGCQIVCLGPEIVEGVGAQEKAWRFELMEYGVRQITFWFNPARQLVRAEYAGLVSTMSTREEALAGLPPSLCSLADED
jgi:PDZ domain